MPPSARYSGVNRPAFVSRPSPSSDPELSWKPRPACECDSDAAWRGRFCRRQRARKVHPCGQACAARLRFGCRRLFGITRGRRALDCAPELSGSQALAAGQRGDLWGGVTERRNCTLYRQAPGERLESHPVRGRPRTDPVYFLDEEETAVRQPLIRSMAAPAAFMRLVTSTFNLDITDKTLVHRQFVAMKRARSQIKCFHLAYPRDFFLLPAVTQAIIDHHSGLDRCLSP